METSVQRLRTCTSGHGHHVVPSSTDVQNEWNILVPLLPLHDVYVYRERERERERERDVGHVLYMGFTLREKRK